MSKGDRSVLVTGGHGFLGRHLVDILLEKGVRVRCLLRPERPESVFAGKPVEVCRGDLRRSEGLAEAVRGVDTVFHLAGLIAASGPFGFRDVNVHGTRRLAAATARHNPGCRRFLYVSSQTAAGPSPDGLPVTEEADPAPISHYGRSRLAAERALPRALGGVPFTVIRPPAIYGPHDAALLPFFQCAALGFAPGLEGPGRRFNLLHAVDVAEGAIAAAESPDAAGKTFFLADEMGVGYDDVARALALAYGRRARRVPLPDVLLRFFGAMTDEVARLFGQTPVFGRQKAIELSQRWWLCSADRARAVFSWQPRIPLSRGMLDTARWYGEAGLVRSGRSFPANSNAGRGSL